MDDLVKQFAQMHDRRSSSYRCRTTGSRGSSARGKHVTQDVIEIGTQRGDDIQDLTHTGHDVHAWPAL